MSSTYKFPLNPVNALANQVIICGADGIAIASNLKTINGQSLLGNGNIAISVDLSAYATTAAVAAGYAPILHTHTAAQITDFAEAVDDEVATLLQAGTDVTVTYNDAGNSLTIGLGANVPRLNAANTFTQSQTFSGAVRLPGSFLEFVSAGFGLNVRRTDNSAFQWGFSLSHGFLIGSGFGVGWSPGPDNSPDARILRNATGPTLETRAAGGLRVCNADGSALGALACGSASVGTNLTVGSVAGSGSKVIFNNANGSPSIENWSNAGIRVNTGTGALGSVFSQDSIVQGTGYFYWSGRALMTSSANGAVHIQNFNFDDVTADQALVLGPGTTASNGVRLKRAMGSSTVQVRNGNDTGDGSLACANVTLSGFTRFGGITKTSLLALTPNATTQGTWRVIDSSPKPNRLARPTGTEWVWCDDETTVT